MSKSSEPIRLLITDTHLKDGNEALVKYIFEQAIDICLSKRIKVIQHIGDWFTSRKSQSLSVLLTTIEIRDMLEKAGIELDIIPGNHDKTDLNSVDSFLSFFHTHRFRVHSDFKFVFITKDISFLLCPYFKEDVWKEKLEAAIEEIDDDAKYVLIGHQAIQGAVNNSGSKVENSLKKSLFKKFDAMFYGHYHNQSGDYIGSAYQANFGEDTEKGVTILYSDLSTEFIRLKFPLYVKFIIDIENKKQYEKLLAEAIKSKKDNPLNTVRVVLTGEKEKLAAFDKSIFAECGLQVSSDFDEVIADDSFEEAEFKVFDNDMLLEEFVDFAIDEELDIEQGIEILKKSFNVVN